MSINDGFQHYANKISPMPRNLPIKYTSDEASQKQKYLHAFVDGGGSQGRAQQHSYSPLAHSKQYFAQPNIANEFAKN